MPGSLFWISSYAIGKEGNDGSKTWWWHWFTNDFSPSPLMSWRDQGKAFTQLRVSLATYKDLRIAGLMTIILSTMLRYVERLSIDEEYKNICHCLKRNFLFNWILYTQFRFLTLLKLTFEANALKGHLEGGNEPQTLKLQSVIWCWLQMQRRFTQAIVFIKG